MRPITLSFTAFGSYPGTHTIEFEKLHELGIFVVTGPTGTGKSTIFDAMVYAIYGALPGDRPESQVRSHYVPETTKCEVVFEFEANGDRYRVTRSPSYLRARKRGDGLAEESGASSIERFDGNEWVGLSSRASEVTGLCAQALGLTASQFERVVLLPQGKFQQFLLAETKDRRPLLQALFGTHVYERTALKLRSNAAEANTKVAEAEAVIAQQLRNANETLIDLEEKLQSFDGLQNAERDEETITSDALRELLVALAPRLHALKSEAERIKTASDSASITAARAEMLETQWRNRQNLRTKQIELLESKDAVDVERIVVEKSQLHRPIVDAADAVERADRHLDDLKQSRSDAQANLLEVLQQLGIESSVDGSDSLVAVTTALTSARNAHKEELEAIAELEQVQGKFGDAKSALFDIGEECDNADTRLAEIEALLVELGVRSSEVAPRAAQAEDSSRLVSELEENLELRKQLTNVADRIATAVTAAAEAELEHQRIWVSFVAGNAPRLARDLEDGAPCPVCGSCEHPDLAVTSDHDIVEFTDVERARSDSERLGAVVREHETEQTLITERLGDDAKVEFVDLKARLDAALKGRDEARAAVEQLRGIEADQEQAREESSTLLKGAAERATRRAEARVKYENLETELSRLSIAVGDLDPSLVAGRTLLFDAAAQRVDEVGEANRLVLEGEGALATERARLAELLKSAKAVDLETAIALVLDPEEESMRAQRIKDYDTERQRTNAALTTFDETDLPDECPDATAEKGKAEELAQLEQSISNQSETAKLRANDVATALDAVESMTAENAAELARYQLLDRVASRCEGRGQSRISLETWVLAGELDRVIAAANVHLQRMTTARYRLERTDDAGHGNRQAGLDLAVRDAHTGRTRPPASLSGGEQFQTSLSLALGLADVVSHGGIASGRRFEALFVDEGFGSLDPDALENAMAALEEIQKAGRMVGVITHVEAMKEVLPIGIRVDRLPNDKGSTLELLPDN
jgi:exonuclease SbcC